MGRRMVPTGCSMMKDERGVPLRTGKLVGVRTGGPVLVYAVSGLGKSTLTDRYPSRVLDGDHFLYAAVALGFPDLEPRAGLRAWRELCRSQPWNTGGEAFERWATIRRAFAEPFVAAMANGNHALMVTSLLEPPYFVSAYYGITRGRYLEHLGLAGRAADNFQSEAMNDRLEGYRPLMRLSPGDYLGNQPEILALIRDNASVP